MICAYIYIALLIFRDMSSIFVSVLPPPLSHACINKMHGSLLILFMYVTLWGSHPLPVFGFACSREKADSVAVSCRTLLEVHQTPICTPASYLLSPTPSLSPYPAPPVIPSILFPPHFTPCLHLPLPPPATPPTPPFTFTPCPHLSPPPLWPLYLVASSFPQL